LTLLASLLLRGVSFFVKKKRKENRIISQIEIIVRVMNLFRILIGGTKADIQKCR
jgi:hypothetical protein